MVAASLCELHVSSEWPAWSLISLWHEVGWFERGIIIVLAAMMLKTIAVSLGSSWRYFVAKRQTKLFLRHSGTLLRQSNLEGTLAASKTFPRSHVASIVASGIEAYLASVPMPWAAHAAEIGWHAAERTRNLTYAQLSVGRNSISNIAATAIYVGVGGTLVGILNSFRGIGTSRASAQGVVSAGLAEALVMIVLGMFVTIAAMILCKRLQAKLTAFELETSNACSELLTKLKAQPVRSMSFESGEAEPIVSGELYREVAYDGQRMVLWPVWIFGILIGWPLIPAAVMALYDVVTSKPAITYGLGLDWSYELPRWGWLSRDIALLLLILLLRALYVAVERLVRYRIARRATERFVAESAAAKHELNLEALARITKSYPTSHVARISACAVDAFRRAAASPWCEDAVAFGRHAGERCGREVMAEMSVGLSSLASVAGVAAFIGFGGTVVGILESFRGYSGTREGYIAMIGAGIAQSLVMTLLGLFVAIVALIAFDQLRSALERFGIETSNATSELLTLFERNIRRNELVPEEAPEEAPVMTTVDVPYDRHNVVLLVIWLFGVFLLCNLARRAGWLPGWW